MKGSEAKKLKFMISKEGHTIKEETERIYLSDSDVYQDIQTIEIDPDQDLHLQKIKSSQVQRRHDDDYPKNWHREIGSSSPMIIED